MFGLIDVTIAISPMLTFCNLIWDFVSMYMQFLYNKVCLRVILSASEKYLAYDAP